VRQITEADLAAARALERLWEKAKKQAADRGRKLTQKEAAADMGWTQGMVSQYIQGITPLGAVAVLKWAQYLGCKPTDIRRDFQFSDLTPGELSPEAAEVGVRWEALPAPIRSAIRDLILNSSH
jgi:transcriptional regulator with XRE-family HTH domain